MFARLIPISPCNLNHPSRTFSPRLFVVSWVFRRSCRLEGGSNCDWSICCADEFKVIGVESTATNLHTSLKHDWGKVLHILLPVCVFVPE